MKIAFANANYLPHFSSGGQVHIDQFIKNVTALGHEIWTWPGEQHPLTKRLPDNRVAKLLKLRDMDAIYMRVENFAPGPIKWASWFNKKLSGQTIFIWEFNTIPEYGYLLGEEQRQIQRHIELFRKYASGCDLAICVSKSIEEYVRENLYIKSTKVISNGSDPDRFKRDITIYPRMRFYQDKVNVVWIGSASIPWHNFSLLSDTARWLHDNHPNIPIEFHILGESFNLIRDMPPNVNYYGTEKYEELPPWLAGMDIGLVLYHPGPADFSSPLKLFDYMASELAVISTEHPQTREIFAELDQIDTMVSHNDYRDLGTKLLYLASNPDQMRNMGMRARKLVVSKYNWSSIVKNIISEIEIRV